MLGDKKSTIEALKSHFAGRREIVIAYLFGSYRQERAYRDIDIAVYVDPASLPDLNREFPYGYAAFLNSELAHLLGYPHVDLTVLNHASPVMLREVLRDGEIVYCRSEEERIRFEIEALKRHADTEILRRIKRQYLKDRIQEGLEAYGAGTNH